MRIVTLGIDDQGRSCVVEDREVETAEATPGVATMSLFRTEECPPVAPPPGMGIFDDMQLVPGTVHFMVVDIAPYSENDKPTLANQLHYNNSIELFCVLEGSMHTILGNGELHLEPGDCVAMPGVDHATHGGPEGARVICMSVGLALTS